MKTKSAVLFLFLSFLNIVGLHFDSDLMVLPGIWEIDFSFEDVRQCPVVLPLRVVALCN